MVFGNLFKLAKLKIDAYNNPAREESHWIRALEVQYNPETLSFKHESVFQQRQGIATCAAHARYSHSRSRTLNVALVFDGTNVGYLGVELLSNVPTVADRVRELLDTCYHIEDKIREPAYLKLS